MGDPTIGTIRRLLETVIETCDDAEAHFHLRTALQLLTLVEERERLIATELANQDIPPELAENLEKLGYLD